MLGLFQREPFRHELRADGADADAAGAQVRKVLAPFSDDERDWILARTAQTLYPSLKD